MKTVTPSKTRRTSRMVNGTQYAIGVEGTVITYECAKAGHRYKVNYGSKRLPISRRMGEAGCRMMVSWHSRAKGGCNGECPECENPKPTLLAVRTSHTKP